MLLTTNGISAQSNSDSIFDYYWQDGSGKILRTGSGGCLHTPQWQTGMSDCPAAALPVVVETQPKVVKVVIEETDFFDFDKSELKQDAITKLTRLVQLVEKPDQFSNIRVVGYTDRIGTDEYNVSLSKRRAESVRDFLVSQNNVSQGKIEVTAMGKSNPRVMCDGAYDRTELIDCLAHNRRVEIFLSFEKIELSN